MYRHISYAMSVNRAPTTTGGTHHAADIQVAGSSIMDAG